nr:hypothetical protein Iba_chr08eCG4660 [Ipomoea batatas]
MGITPLLGRKFCSNNHHPLLSRHLQTRLSHHMSLLFHRQPCQSRQKFLSRSLFRRLGNQMTIARRLALTPRLWRHSHRPSLRVVRRPLLLQISIRHQPLNLRLPSPCHPLTKVSHKLGCGVLPDHAGVIPGTLIMLSI